MRVINSVDLYEAYTDELLDEGLRSRLKSLFGRKKEAQPKPMSRGEQLRKKYDINSGSRTPKALILDKTRKKAEEMQRQYGGSIYSKDAAKPSADRYNRYLEAGYSKYHAKAPGGSGNKWRRRLVSKLGVYNKQANPKLKYDVYAPDNRRNINAEFELWVNELVNEGYDLSENTWEDMYDLYESYDNYLTVIGYLLDEGYVDDVELAEEMITYMSDDWLESIIGG